MKKNLDLILFFIAGLILASLTMIFQRMPGYMDASYSYSIGLQLVNGKGFVEPFLWNYLDNPTDVAHPSHTYWMPLPSLLAALGMWIGGNQSYDTARIFFILLAAVIPLLTAMLAEKLTGNRRHRILAGLLSLFPGFYGIFSTATETFTLYMVFGGAFFLLLLSIWNQPIQKNLPRSVLRFFILGLITGAMHLTRADGILWLAAAFGVVGYTLWKDRSSLNKHIPVLIGIFLTVFFGYLVIMLPWYIRNFHVFSSLFPPGNSKTLWLTDYDQTYIYPADLLNFQSWLSAGFSIHLKAWGSALAQNLGSWIGVQGCVVYFPLILVGLYQLRKQPTVWFGCGIWILIGFVMTLVFPFAGPRGGFFHSTASIQPLFWSVVPIGLERVISLGVRWRGWNFDSANRFFSVSLVVFCALITFFLYTQRVIGPDLSNPKWQTQERNYQRLEYYLQSKDIPAAVRVMVNDPPGYYVAARRQSVPVPYGNIQTILDVSARYGILYLLLEPNHPEGISDLYINPTGHPGFDYLGIEGDTRIFRLCPMEDCISRNDP